MNTTTIRGVPVQFPCEPYQLQVDYMSKVIECLQNQTNGVLESPTGTGKTFALLCSSLAWLQVKKAEVQAQRVLTYGGNEHPELFNLQVELHQKAGKGDKEAPAASFFQMTPKIIYASRTHSQLSQAMQELKRTPYNYMRAVVLGSREQMCIHPEVVKLESNSTKTQMCRLKVKSRSCKLYNNVERNKGNPALSDLPVVDIEDIVRLGNEHCFCPYYMSRDLKNSADIIFAPYNYLLDPRMRESLDLRMQGSIVIFDEAHNIEKICEDSASIQLKSTEITLAIEEVTGVMQVVSEGGDLGDFNGEPQDFSAEDLCRLKQSLLDFEKALDGISINNNDGSTFEGDYIYEIFEKANISRQTVPGIVGLIDRMVTFLATTGSGPFQRRGTGIEAFSNLMRLAFAMLTEEFRKKIKKCYKVHITNEDTKGKADWLSRAMKRTNGRVLSFWCFSPGFGMNFLMDQQLHCVILTSGTLSPLAPLVSELELSVPVRLENPHIVDERQVYVKIITQGPDKEQLLCNFQNRDNPKYLSSLGRVISNLIRFIPNGVLIFFPSYPLMNKCLQYWQEEGTWATITQQKQIFVEPRDKVAFGEAMNDYYANVESKTFNGAIFMGVCRGKVSEGLDFADANGRAVFIIGLPYPPLKDPRVILKKKYLDLCNLNDRQFLKGDDWYSLEATRAINQAIGRVIRHKNDYGAIILLDSRFPNPRVKSNLSLWLRNHITVSQNFGDVVRSLRSFFTIAQTQFPVVPKLAIMPPVVQPVYDQVEIVTQSRFFNSSSSSSSDCELIKIKRNTRKMEFNPVSKKAKIVVVAAAKSNENDISDIDSSPIKKYIIMVQQKLDTESFTQFNRALANYRVSSSWDELTECLDQIFKYKFDLRYIIGGLETFIHKEHLEMFKIYCVKMNI